MYDEVQKGTIKQDEKSGLKTNKSRQTGLGTYLLDNRAGLRQNQTQLSREMPTYIAYITQKAISPIYEDSSSMHDGPNNS